jgi:hypothetical protein
VNKLLLVALGLVLAIATWALGVPGLKRLQRSRRRAAATDTAARVLVAWDEAAEALGVTRVGRRPAETMSEYAGRAGRSVPLPDAPSAALVALADDAAAASYGAALPAAESVDRAETAAASVTSAVREVATTRQRVLFALDPRPLFSRRRA